MKATRIWCTLAACLLLAAHGQQPVEGGEQPVRPRAEAAAGPPPVREGEAAATEAARPVTVEEAETGEDLLSMEVTEASLPEVLRSLASMRPRTNLIIGPDVEGTVSFALRDVTWETALNLITEAHEYEVTREGENLFRVHKPAPAKKEPVVVEILTAADVEAMSDEQIAGLLDPVPPGETRAPEQARQTVLASADNYIKRLSVEDEKAATVVAAIAKAADLSYAFSAAIPTAAAAPAQEGAAEQTEADAAGKKEKDQQQTRAAFSPPISLNLKYIDVEAALKLVCRQGGLSCVDEDGVWVVTPLPPAQLQLEPLKLETFELEFINIDEDLLAMTEGLLSPRGHVSRGKNNVLVVQDTADSIETVRQALDVMDVPTPQVLIEARFFELSDSARTDLGIDWNALGSEGISFSSDPYTYDKTETWGTDKQTDLGTFSEETEIMRDLTTGAISGTSTTTESFGTLQNLRSHMETSTRSAILDMAQFGVVLHALRDMSDAKQLSNPKIVVNSDEQATIHIGEQTPIIKSTVESTEGGNPIRTFELDPDFGGETIEEIDLAPEEGEGRRGRMRKYTTPKGYLDLGTKLTVSPSVKTEEEIYIKVVPELISVIDFESLGTGENRIRYPVLFSTRVNTEFTIRSGQTIAIGGLVNEQTRNNETKVPLLGSVPALGRLFRYNLEEKVQSETIIFLTVKSTPSEGMVTSTGIPSRSYLVQPKVERIEHEDSEGAEYSQERARERMLEELEEAYRKKNRYAPGEWKKRMQEALGEQAPPPDADAPAENGEEGTP